MDLATTTSARANASARGVVAAALPDDCRRLLVVVMVAVALGSGIATDAWPLGEESGASALPLSRRWRLSGRLKPALSSDACFL